MKHLKRFKIQLFIDNELSNEECKIAETHLAECKECKSVETNIRKKISFLKNVIAESGVERTPEMKFVPEIPKEISRKKKYIRLPVPVFAAMIGIIVFMGLMLLFNGNQAKGSIPEIEGKSIVNYVRVESESSREISSINLDLSEYSAIKKPKIRVIKRGKTKNEKI